MRIQGGGGRKVCGWDRRVRKDGLIVKTKEQRAAPGDTQDLSLSHPWCTHGVSIEVGGRDRTKVMADGATRVCWRTVFSCVCGDTG